MLDAHRIAPRLWQGSRPPEGKTLRTAGVDVLVLCAFEYQPPARDFPGVELLHAPMDDGDIVPWRLAMRTASAAAARYCQGKRILVTCNQGRNRSGLVTALILWTLNFGSGKRCADHVRQHRPNALTNEAFYRWLATLPRRGSGARC